MALWYELYRRYHLICQALTKSISITLTVLPYRLQMEHISLKSVSSALIFSYHLGKLESYEGCSLWVFLGIMFGKSSEHILPTLLKPNKAKPVDTGK